MVKTVVFGSSKWPTLISRKIWVAEINWKLHIVKIAEILFDKTFVKATFLLQKLQRGWIDEIYFGERKFFIDLHKFTLRLSRRIFYDVKSIHQVKIIWILDLPAESYSVVSSTISLISSAFLIWKDIQTLLVISFPKRQ